MAEYDLTNLVAPFLDRHLVFPLLEFLSSKSIYPENDLLQGKIELLSATNMVDFQIDIYKKLHNVEETPSDMEGRREKVVKELSTLQEKVKPFIEFLSNESLIHQLRQEKLYTPSYLKEKHSITGEQIETLYKFAKFQFECGNYSGAMNCLTHYLPLSVGPNGERTRRYFSALWGKFAAEILLLNWESALKDMEELKQLIESGSFGTPVEQLQQRAWLIHWSLFIYFHYPEASVGLIDLCFYQNYLSTIQNICPHILRYLTAVAIINHTNNSGNKYRKNAVKELVKVLQQEQNSYRDPITEFLECLFVHFDFEGAQNKLRECEKVLLHDFFLVGLKDEFIENARFFIFETYCRIHQCIDIKMLAEKLNMENDQAEKWIVDLIRNARLDAKIDSAQGHIIMGSHNPTVYEQILEKTRDLYYKTQSIALTLTQDA